MRGNCSFIMTRSLRVAASRIYSHLMSQPKEWKLAENFLNWRFSHPSINAGFPPQRYPTSTNSVAHFHTTYYLEKKKQSTKKQKSKDRATPMEDEEDLPASAEELVDKAELESSFDSLIVKLQQEYANKLSIRTNISSYSSLPVTLPDKKSIALQFLGQVTMKGQNTVVVNMSSNPQYVSHVRDCLSKSSMNINPRIDGTTIFIETPKVTIEHREKMAKSAKELCVKTKDEIRKLQNNKVKFVQKAKSRFSIDDLRQVEKDIMQMAAKCTKKSEEVMKAKQKELLGGS